jgi:hypothetical protein
MWNAESDSISLYQGSGTNTIDLVNSYYTPSSEIGSNWAPGVALDQTVVLQPGITYQFAWSANLSGDPYCDGTRTMQFSVSLTPVGSGTNDGGTGSTPAPAMPPTGTWSLALSLGAAAALALGGRLDRSASAPGAKRP